MPRKSIVDGGRLARAARFGAALFTIWLVPAMLPAADEESLPAPQFDVPAVPARLVFPKITIERDPFVPGVSADKRSLPKGEDGGPASFVLPPNAGALGAALRGVIVGARPKALLEIGGKLRIVGVGAPVGDALVLAISPSAVVLDNGETLRLTPARP